jgi:hypothetical protein
MNSDADKGKDNGKESSRDRTSAMARGKGKVTVNSRLKGPKREIFGLGIFAQIRPILIGYLGTRPKNPKKIHLGPYNALYFPRFLC